MVLKQQEFSGQNKYLSFKIISIQQYITIIHLYISTSRLVHHKDYIDQEEIQQLAMIPAKEAKLLMYTLLEENFLKIRETKKGTNSTAHAKTVFLYHIDIDEVVQKEIEHCYHALYNIMKRRDHESANNKRMVDKQLRIQTLSDDLKEHGATEQQLADVNKFIIITE